MSDDEEICYCGQRMHAGERRCSFCGADLAVVRRGRARERGEQEVHFGEFGTLHTRNGGCGVALWNGLVIFGWAQILFGVAVLAALIVLAACVLLPALVSSW